MENTSQGLIALIDLWARRYRLSASQRVLLETAAAGERRTLAPRMLVTEGELQILEKLFAQRTGRTLEEAVMEIRRIAQGRARQSQIPMKAYQRLTKPPSSSSSGR